MSAACRLLTGIAVLGLSAISALAEPALIRGPDLPGVAPYSRDDALRQRLTGHRPEARPVWMIRYPAVVETRTPEVRPLARPGYLVPEARWDFRDDGQAWSRAAMSALAAHGAVLETLEPRDIDTWCPGYRTAGPVQRRAFWVGMMSALAKHESTWNPRAVGGGGQWYGLLQIYPPTARGYGCRARTGEALKNPADNLSCAVRIMAVTVARDNAIAVHNGRWRGVAADWGPMTNRGKIAEMSAWTRQQDYCRPQSAIYASLRPEARPTRMSLSTMSERSGG